MWSKESCIANLDGIAKIFGKLGNKPIHLAEKFFG